MPAPVNEEKNRPVTEDAETIFMVTSGPNPAHAPMPVKAPSGMAIPSSHAALRMLCMRCAASRARRLMVGVSAAIDSISPAPFRETVTRSSYETAPANVWSTA